MYVPENTAPAMAEREAEVFGVGPRIATVDRAQVAEEVLAATSRLRADLFGDVPELSLEHVPEIMVTLHPFGNLWQRVMALSMEVMGPHCRLSRRDQKLAILRTGWLLGAPYEFGEHVAQSHSLGFTTEEIERIVAQGSSAPEWSEHEGAILKCAEELRERATVSEATWATLSKSLDAQQLFELLVLIGQFTNVAYFQNALGLRLEHNNAGLASR